MHLANFCSLPVWFLELCAALSFSWGRKACPFLLQILLPRKMQHLHFLLARKMQHLHPLLTRKMQQPLCLCLGGSWSNWGTHCCQGSLHWFLFSIFLWLVAHHHSLPFWQGAGGHPQSHVSFASYLTPPAVSEGQPLSGGLLQVSFH